MADDFKLLRLLGSGLQRLPRGLFLVAGRLGAPRNDEGHRLDPAAHLFCTLDGRLSPPLSREGIPFARARTDAMMPVLDGPAPHLPREQDLTLPGPAGPIKARLYGRAPGSGPPQPTLLYLHGGGWVLGSVASYASLCRRLAAGSGWAVLAIDYRLSPEDPHPAALEDALAAYRWLNAHGRDHGLDPDALAVGGDSAGGNLSALLCQRLKADAARHAQAPSIDPAAPPAATPPSRLNRVAARPDSRLPTAPPSRLKTQDSGLPLPLPRLQILIYPATDLRAQAPSHTLFAEGFFLTHHDITFYRGCSVPDPARWGAPDVSPLLEGDLTGLPDALVITAGFDPLRDEGRQYAEALRAAGVSTALREYETMIHGFLSLCGLFPQGLAAIDEATAALKGALITLPR